LTPTTAPRLVLRVLSLRLFAPRVRAVLLALAALALLAPITRAAAATFDPEAGLPKIQNFPPEVYRGHSQIFATARTADGVMYFGTYGAVVSYDGERWRQFPLPGTWTRALTVGPDGLLYVGGGNLLGRLEPAPLTGELRFVSLAALLPAAQRDFASVWSAATSGSDVLFTLDGAVLAWREGAFRVWPFPGQRPALRAAGPAVFCHVGEKLLRWRDGAWQPFLSDPRLGAIRRLTVLPAATGIILALDNGQLLRVADTGAITPWATSANAFLARAGIRNGLRLADGGYLLSTAGEGVLQLAADGTAIRRLAGASGLANSATYGLANGVDDSVWVETANGLSVFHPLRPWSFFDPRNGRPDTIGGEPLRIGRDLVLSMSDVPPRRLVPAADATVGAHLEPVSASASGRVSNGISLHGALLAGAERGVMLLGPESRLIHPTVSQAEDVLALNAVPGVLVVGMLRGIETVRVQPDFTATRLAVVPDFQSETTNLIETGDRTVWAGTTAGLALRLQFDAAGALTRQTVFDATRGLPAEIGWVRVQAYRGEPLVITKQGVFHLDPTGEKLVPDPRFARHFPAGVNTLPIESDGGSRFWFQIRRADGGFEFGCLDLAAPGAPRWTPLPAEIGASLGFSGARSIIFLRENGRDFLWISGTRCTVRHDLGAPLPAAAAPTVVISQLARGDAHWRPRAAPLDLEFSRDPLRILFASPHTVSSPITYETRLLGYDERWTTATAAEATYTNLSGGPFTLEVRARDALGHVGAPARTTFSVAPPWHRTAAAYALYALAAAAAIFVYIRWRLSRGERERARLEALVATRTADLAVARDQAEAASRAKSAFLASMSHELRTPLNGVLGYAQLLQGDPRLAPDQQERLRIVHTSGEHLLHMINDVLDLAKIEAGKLTLRPAPFALGDLLHDIAAAHLHAAGGKGLAFTLDLAPDLPAWVEADAQKLRQVLDNLVGNAIKFTATGTVTLRVHLAPPVSQPSILNSQRHTERVAFAVLDTGPGISTQDQARLFQAFEQADNPHTTAAGTGLGLAISRALVERFGGALTLDSAPGRGSTFAFTLTLPVVAPGLAAASAGRRIVGYSGRPRRALIVDDHAVNRRLLTDLLTPLGFDCADYASPTLALDRLTTGAEPWPDLAVLDLRMPDLDGLELTRRLRALPRGASLKIVLTSASVIAFDPAEATRAGCDDFLAKPFRTADLLEKLGRLLGLTWRESDSAPPFPVAPSAAPASAPLPTPVRAALRELLATGDLEAFSAELAKLRSSHPACAPAFDNLAAAAASFQLARLRQLLD
jgi:signal transduction histidine kinase/CheY-like chemotaxis protein